MTMASTIEAMRDELAQAKRHEADTGAQAWRRLADIGIRLGMADADAVDLALTIAVEPYCDDCGQVDCVCDEVADQTEGA